MPRPTLRYRTQMKKSTRKLVSNKLELRSETVRALGALDLTHVVGGDALYESGINCPVKRAADTSGGANNPCVLIVPISP